MAPFEIRYQPLIVCCLLLTCARATVAQNGQGQSTVPNGISIHVTSVPDNPPKPPTLEENQNLINSLDDEIAQNAKLLFGDEHALVRDLALQYAGKVAPARVEQLKEVIEAALGGAKTGVDINSAEYAQSVYDLTLTIAGILGGPAAVAAAGTDLLRTLAEMALILTYQGSLIDQRWKLAESIQYAQFKDPKDQAEFKRILERMNADLPKQQAAFQQGLVKRGMPRQKLVASLFKNTSSDPLKTVAVGRGLAIVDPEQYLKDAAAIPGINPDFIDALNKCSDQLRIFLQKSSEFQSLTQIDVNHCLAAGKDPSCYQSEAAGGTALQARAAEAEMMTCNKYDDGTYIPAFGAGRGLLASSEHGGPPADNVPDSIAGSWELLPGSYSSMWPEDHPEGQQQRQPNSGWLHDIRRVGPGHFQTSTSRISTLELYGSDAKASGDSDDVVAPYVGGERNVHVQTHIEVWLSDSKLYEKETEKIIQPDTVRRGQLSVWYQESYSIAAFRGVPHTRP